MPDFFRTSPPPRVRIEVPGSLMHDSAYGIYITNEAQEDKIVRVVVEGEVVVKIRPDGEVEICGRD